MVIISQDFALRPALRAPQGKSVGQLLAETAHGATNSAALGTVCVPRKDAATAMMGGLASSVPLRLSCFPALAVPANIKTMHLAGTTMNARSLAVEQEEITTTCPSPPSDWLMLQTAALRTRSTRRLPDVRSTPLSLAAWAVTEPTLEDLSGSVATVPMLVL